MLRPSRPMMRPLRSSLGRSTTETVVSIGVLGGGALNRLGDVLLGAVGGRLARFGVEPLEQVGGVVPRVALDLLDAAAPWLRRPSGWRRARARAAAGRPAARTSSAAASACFSRSATACSRAGRSFSSRSAAACRSVSVGFAAVQRLLERLRLLALLARLPLGLREELVRLFLGLEQRLFLAGFGVALGVLDDAERPVPRRGRRFRRRCACGWRPRRRTRPPPSPG